MGDSASKVRKEAEASTEQAQKETAEKIKILEELGSKVVRQFQSEVLLDNDPHKFKIDKIFDEQSSITLMTGDDTKKLKDSVHSVVAGILHGDIVTVISGIVNTGIDAMIASAAGSVAEKKVYAVKLEGIGLQRVDIYLYQYDLSVSGLIDKYDKLFVYAYTVSSIGEKITKKILDDFISLTVPSVDEKGNPLSPEEIVKKQLKLYGLLKPVLLENSEEEESNN